MVGPRIADPADDGQLLVVPYLREALEGGIEAKLIVNVQNFVYRISQLRPHIVIGTVGVGNHGVDAVVAAVERDDHQHTAALGERPFLGRLHQVRPAATHRARQQPAAPAPALAIRNFRRLRLVIRMLATTSGIREC